MNIIIASIFGLNALTGAHAAAVQGETFGPVFDPSLVNCQEVRAYGETWTMCVTYQGDKTYYE